MYTCFSAHKSLFKKMILIDKYMSNNIIWSKEFTVDETRLKVSECGKLMRFSCRKWKISNLKPCKRGYSRCELTNGKMKRVHRLVFKGFNPEWDIYDTRMDNSIDHIDEDPYNNALDNLRVSTNSQNSCNKGVQKNSRTKIKNINVHYDKRRDTWFYKLKITKKGMKTITKTIDMGNGKIPDDFSVENYHIPQEIIDLLRKWLPIMHGEFAKHPLIRKIDRLLEQQVRESQVKVQVKLRALSL